MNILRSLAVASLCAALTGCFSANTVSTRHFLLTPTSATTTTAANTGLRVGVASVKMPDYLLPNSMAIRKDAGEVTYLETASWAERLDKNFARVLAANQSAMIPTDQIRLGAWRAEDVTVEVHVTVEQFDVDESGKGTLIAWWRITAPGGAKVLKSGEARVTKTGKAPAAVPQNIAATLSDLVAQLSDSIAPAIRDAASH